jgi:hypothetical protein
MEPSGRDGSNLRRLSFRAPTRDPTSFLASICYFCLTLPMTLWDEAAHTRLKQVVEDLRVTGIVDLFEQIIKQVWRANTERFEPTELGDTNASLGFTANENIRTLMMRRGRPSAERSGLADSVRIETHDNSLLVHAAGVRVRYMKSAALSVLREPNWDNDFSWARSNTSDIRKGAADGNLGVYNPLMGNQPVLFDPMYAATGNVDYLRETMLVWAGGSESSPTAAWLGFPTSGSRPWLAIEQLWWQEPGSTGTGRRDGTGPIGDDAFTRRPVPEPTVTLKNRPKTAEQ